jgi:hypothetical protein
MTESATFISTIRPFSLHECRFGIYSLEARHVMIRTTQLQGVLAAYLSANGKAAYTRPFISKGYMFKPVAGNFWKI